MKNLLLLSLLGLALGAHAKEKNIQKLMKEIKEFRQSIGPDVKDRFQGWYKLTKKADGSVVNYYTDSCYYEIFETATSNDEIPNGYIIRIFVGYNDVRVHGLSGSDLKYGQFTESYSTNISGEFYKRYFEATPLMDEDGFILYVSKYNDDYDVEFYCTIK